MVTQSYGSYSPQAIDPFPIETELAKAAITSPAQAQNLLDLYQTQRATSEGNYNYAMQGQHDFAKQQLAAQMQENYLKALPELSKPGIAGLVANAPNFQGVLGGASPESVADMVRAANQANQATNLEHAGSGALSASSAGMPVDPQAFTNLTNLPVNPGVRPDIQIAEINKSARLGAAAIGASGTAGPSLHYTGPPDPTIGNGQIGVTVPGKAHWTPQQMRDYAIANGLAPRGLTSIPTAPAASGGGGGKSTPAPAKTPALPPPALPDRGKPLDAAGPGVKKAMDDVRTKIENNKSPAAMDIKAGMAQNGGNPIIIIDKNGKPGVYGAKGGPY